MSNHYIWAFGGIRFYGDTGAGREYATFTHGKGYLILTPLGTEKENDDYDLIIRQKGFRVKIITKIDNWDTTQRDELIKLFLMITNLNQTPEQTANKTIGIVPAYSTDADAVNFSYDACLSLGQQLKFAELVENQESVQNWIFNWIVPVHITELPTYLTTFAVEYLQEEDGTYIEEEDGTKIEL